MTDNPYASLHGQLDLSTATFEAIKIDEAKLNATLQQIQAITQSNLEQRAKWNSILTSIDLALRTAGMVTRIVAVT